MSKTFELGLAIIAFVMALMFFFAMPTIIENPSEGSNVLVNILTWFVNALASLVTAEVNRAVSPFLWLASAPMFIVLLWVVYQAFIGGQ